MNPSGPELLRSIKSMRDFLADAGLLLQTADALMQEQGWIPTGRETLSGLSYLVGAGAKWMPRYATRIYQHESSYENITSMIAILLDDHENGETSLLEPLVTAACFLLPDASEEILPWQAYWCLWLDHGTSGKPVFQKKADPTAGWKPSFKWNEMAAFALPLVNITDTATLKTQVTTPLFAVADLLLPQK